MNGNSIPMTSITYALKAQNLLRGKRIFSSVGRDERYMNGTGCGYALFFRNMQDKQRAVMILRENNRCV